MDDDAVESEGECSSILRSALKSPAREMDGIESWSLNESIESRLSPLVVTEIFKPPLLVI